MLESLDLGPGTLQEPTIHNNGAVVVNFATQVVDQLVHITP